MHLQREPAVGRAHLGGPSRVYTCTPSPPTKSFPTKSP